MPDYEKIFYLWLSSKNVKQSTAANYHIKFFKYVIPYLYILLNRETNKYLNILKVLGLSTKTVCDVISVINNFFNFAYNNDYVDNFIHIKRPKIAQDETEIFTKDEVRTLENALYANLDSVNIGILLSLFTGIRIGELCALKWTYVDLSNQLIKIRYTLQRVKNIDKESKKKTIVIIDEPKTKRSRRNIPIPDFLKPLLNQYKSDDEHYLLTGNNKYMEPRTLQKKFKNLLNKINVPYKKFHCLRHTFATNAYYAGMPIDILSKILGHESEEFTKSRYVHSNAIAYQEEMNAIYRNKKLLFCI